MVWNYSGTIKAQAWHELVTAQMCHILFNYNYEKRNTLQPELFKKG